MLLNQVRRTQRLEVPIGPRGQGAAGVVAGRVRVAKVGADRGGPFFGTRTDQFALHVVKVFDHLAKARHNVRGRIMTVHKVGQTLAIVIHIVHMRTGKGGRVVIDIVGVSVSLLL